MNYTREDYVELYGDHWIIRSSRRAHLMIGVALAGLVLAFALVAGSDAEDAANIAQDEQVAHAKKQALVGIPCGTWVCQKHFDHEPCGRAGNTACAPSADLRSEK